MERSRTTLRFALQSGPLSQRALLDGRVGARTGETMRGLTLLLAFGAGTLLTACLQSVPGASCSSGSDCKGGSSCVRGVCMLAVDAGHDGFSCNDSSECGTDAHAVCVNKICTTDTELPVLSVSVPTSGATVGVRFTITGTASDALSGVSSVEYSFDGASWAALALSGNAFSQSVASPTAGTTSTLAVRATDRAGNVAAVSIPLKLDLVPPVLTLEPSPDSA